MVKHVWWKFGEQKGLYGLRIKEFENATVIETKNIKGKLPARLLFALFDHVLPDWRERANREFLANCKLWKVEIRTGRSGCFDIITKRLIDEDFAVVRVTAKLHITMSERLDDIGPTRLGELAPALRELARFCGQIPSRDVVMKAIEPRLEGFLSPEKAPIEVI